MKADKVAEEQDLSIMPAPKPVNGPTDEHANQQESDPSNPSSLVRQLFTDTPPVDTPLINTPSQKAEDSASQPPIQTLDHPSSGQEKVDLEALQATQTTGEVARKTSPTSAAGEPVEAWLCRLVDVYSAPVGAAVMGYLAPGILFEMYYSNPHGFFSRVFGVADPVAHGLGYFSANFKRDFDLLKASVLSLAEGASAMGRFGVKAAPAIALYEISIQPVSAAGAFVGALLAQNLVGPIAKYGIRTTGWTVRQAGTLTRNGVSRFFWPTPASPASPPQNL